MKNNQCSTEILITGGTGLLGREVCDLFDRMNIPYSIGTHSSDGLKSGMVFMDLATGKGIREAVAGRKTILHLASDKKNPDNDVKGTKILLAELQRLPPPVHLIYISIVGVDLLNMPYFKQKWQTEQLIASSGIPFSILRATQFHEYLDQVLSSLLKFPVGLLPKKVPVQPVSVAPVAEALFQIAQREPACSTINLGGKQVIPIKIAADSWLKKRNKKRLIMNFPIWGTPGRNLAGGALVCDQATTDGQTWEEWLQTHRQ